MASPAGRAASLSSSAADLERMLRAAVVKCRGAWRGPEQRAFEDKYLTGLIDETARVTSEIERITNELARAQEALRG